MKKLFLLMAAAIMTLAAQASSRQVYTQASSRQVYTESETTFPKKHLIEEFTGQDCQYCPKGMDSLHAFIGNEEKWIVVCHHTYYEDNFKIDESKTIASELNVTAAPSACFNRKETTEGLLVDYVSFRKLDKAQFGDRTYASIVLNNSYDAATRTLAVHVEGQVMQNVQNLKLTVLVKESGMIAYQRDVDKTLEQYIHNDAVRTFLTDVKGNMVNVSDNRYAADYTVELDAKWVASNCTVVAFLAEDFMPVVQAEQKPVIVPKQVYTEYKDGVLTYYCDNKKDSREGTTETYDPVNEPNKARFAEYAKNVTKAVIDQSMKDTMLTSLSRMFFGGYSYTLEKLTKIEGMENLNTEKAKDMSYMFCDCGALESIDLTSFSTANVTTMERMFYGCRTLTTLDVRRFNINKVTNMADMFAYCYELTTIYCNDDWSQSNALTNGYEMFEEDIKLVGGNGTKWTEWSKDEEGARPDKDGQMGYFTERTLLNVTVSGYGAIPAAGMEITLKDAKMDNTTGKLQMLLEGYVAAEGTLTVTVSRSSDGIVDDFCHAGKCTTGNGTKQQTFTYQSTGNTEWSAHYKPSKETVETIVYTFSDGFETRVLTVHYDSQKIFSVETYTVYESESNGHSILTFYYDKNRYTHTGENVKKVESYEQGKELKNYYPSEVVIDESFKNVKLTSLAGMFKYLSQTKKIKGLGNIDCSEVTDMSEMFQDCRALTSLDLSSFNTANVKNMSNMFNYCMALETIKFGESFNTANVTDMSEMFYHCTALKSLDLSSFNTANVTNMEKIFYDCEALQTIKFGEAFAAKVSDLSLLFCGCTALKSLDLSSFNTANVTDMNNMFGGCAALETIKFGEDFAANVTNMLGMFYKCSSLKSLDLSSFNTANVQSMYGMFEECTALETVKFGEAFAANVIDMREMFQDCSSLKSLDLSSFNTANVQSMYTMFYNCTALETIKFGESFNTANVIDMGFMFGACLSLKSLNLSSFNTAKVTDMNNMFGGCAALETIKFGESFNTAKVTDMICMFYGCSALTTIYCDDDWSTSTAVSRKMFDGCSKLKGGNGTEWKETNPTDKSYARLDKEGEPGYFTSAKILKQQKDELNALIQELKALYDFAKQYVGESELANLKKSIEGFEAVYNDGAEAEVSKAISDAQTALKNVKATVMPTSKTAAKATLDGMLRNGDNDNCKDIINDAKGKIDALAWDDTKTAEENTAILEPAIKKIIDDAEKALAAERDAMTIAAAKAKLNAAIQDLKAIYDFAKQYVGESELANLKRSIEGFEAVYNDKAATAEDINKAASEAQAALKNVKIVMMPTGKTILKATLNGMLLPTDSEEAKDIIKDAKDKIDALAWDDSKTVEENIAALDKAVKAILAKAEKDIEATRNTGIDEVESQKTKAESLKVIRNGQLLIIRDGKTYNAVGAEVR